MPLVGLEPFPEGAGETREIRRPTSSGGAESGALSDGSVSILSVLMKLVAGLTSEERATLARELEWECKKPN